MFRYSPFFFVKFMSVMVFLPCFAEASAAPEDMLSKCQDSLIVLGECAQQQVSGAGFHPAFRFKGGEFSVKSIPERGGGNGKSPALFAPQGKHVSENNAQQNKQSGDKRGDNWDWYIYSILPIVMAFSVGLFSAPKSDPFGGLNPNVEVTGVPALSARPVDCRVGGMADEQPDDSLAGLHISPDCKVSLKKLFLTDASHLVKVIDWNKAIGDAIGKP